MYEFKKSKLRSGHNGTKARSRKQAITIGLPEARKEIARVSESGYK